MLRSVISSPEPEPPGSQREIDTYPQLTLVKENITHDIGGIMKYRKDISSFAQKGSIADLAKFAYIMKGEDVRELFDKCSPLHIKYILEELRNIIKTKAQETSVNPDLIDDHIKHKYNKSLQGIFGKFNHTAQESNTIDLYISHYMQSRQEGKSL